MTILVSVRAGRAQAQLAALQAQQKGLNASMAAGAASKGPVGASSIMRMQKFGNQLQWTGRMLQYNFTLPLLAAAAASTYWALNQEKEFTHVAKVYGDTQAAAAQFRKEMGLGQKAAEDLAEAYKTDELEALDKAFTAISNHYGVQKTEVLQVAGAWAAAGASGRDLAESVNATMKAIIIGDMDAAQATKALISVQAQYNFNTKELNGTLATFNSIENSTAVSMSDLIVAFEKSAGVARSAGIEARQLAAYVAALVPASGSAATAGNALKTIISRLVAPTKETTQVLDHLGFSVKDAGWQSATVTEQLQLLAEQFQTMGKKAQGAAASVIASRWQVNRFDILMKQIVDDTGNYAKALQSSKDQGESFTRMQDELNTVLESNPRKLQRMWVMLQNAMVDVVQPLIPFIIYLAGEVADLAQAFANLDPHAQKLILFLLTLLASVGPIVRYMGALTTLFWVFAKTVFVAGGAVGWFGKMLWALMTPFRMLGTIILTFLGFVASGFKLMVIRSLQFMGFLTIGIARAFLSNAVIGAAAFMWTSLLKVTKLGSGAVFGVNQAFHLASVAAQATASAAQNATAAAGGATYVKTQKMTSNAAGGVWGLHWKYLEAFHTAFWAATHSIETAGQTGMAAIDSTATAARAEAMGLYYDFLLGVQRGYFVASRGLAAAASASMIALEAGEYATRQGMLEAFLAWRMGILRAFFIAERGLAAGQTASMLAIEAGAQPIRVASWQVANTAIVASNVAAGTATVGIWARVKAVLLAMLIPLKGPLVAAFRGLFVVMGAVGTVLLSPWGLAIAAILGLLYAFRDQVKQIWNNIVAYVSDSGFSIVGTFQAIADGILRAFYSLPQGVQDAMIAVVTVVRDAAMAVYEWFQYINPWAQHSPSLVQNVTTGIDEVTRQFSKLGGIKNYVAAAYAEIKRFGNLTAKLGMSVDQAQRNEDRATLKKAGANKALGSYNKLLGILNRLNPVLKVLEARMNAQQMVVDRWQDKVDKANRALDAQQDKLNDLQKVLDKYQGKLDEAQGQLDYYASAPLVGMRAMEEQIFRNQMAQTKLRYEMMKFEDVNGTFDELKSKIEAINGAQEVLRGTQASLRAGGAGSDILSQYDKEMDKLDKQKDKYKDAADTLAEMQVRLDALQREADRLDLVKAMKFDELQHQIEMAANRMKELPFNEIMEGIRDANAQIDKYGPKVDAASAAVDRQQKVVDRLTAARDRLQDRLDAEQAVLDRITEKYDNVNGAIQAINDSISDVVSNASKMNEKLDKKKAGLDAKKKDAAGAKPYISPGLQNLLDAKNFTYPDPGGKGIPPRSDWSNQSKLIDKFTQQMADKTANAFEDLNPFAPLKKKAIEWWNWLKEKSKEVWAEVVDFMGAAFSGVDFGSGGGIGKLGEKFKSIGKFVTQVLRDIAKFGKFIWDIIGPDVIKAGQEIWKSLKRAWNELGPLFASFGDLIEPMGKAIKNLWTILKPLLIIVLAPFIAAMITGFKILPRVVGPAIDMIVDFIKNFVKILRGALKIVIGLLTWDWAMVWSGVVDVVSGSFLQIWAIIKGLGKIAWGIISYFITPVIDAFNWLKDQLVGHSIVPDIIDAIFFYFELLINIAKIVWRVFIKPTVDLFLWLFDKVVQGFKLWWGSIKLAFAALKAIAGWLWRNVLYPAWLTFKYVWTKHIWPFLKKWWPGLKAAWNALKKAAIWLWNEVLHPIWNRVVYLWKNAVRPELAKWWDRIKTTWNNLKTLAIYVWNNFLKPVWDKVKKLWTDTHAELSKWKERILRAWDTLKSLGTWIKNNVMDPVFTAIKNGWERVKEWLVSSKDLLTSPVKGIMGSVRSVMNTVIGGLNKVSDMLPGIDFHVALIPEFAKGGGLPSRRIGGGFKTNGARAIVGEGKANYPEFVIPTDPTYRNRARSLLAMAAAKIGPGNTTQKISNATDAHPSLAVPEFGIGGWIDDKWDDVKNMADKLKDQIAKLGKNAIGAIMNPLISVAENKIKDLNYGPAEAAGLYTTGKIKSWVSSSDSNLNSFVTAAVKAQKSGAGSVAVDIPANAGGLTSWKGGTFTNLFVAHMKKAEQIGHGSISVTQGGFRPATSYSGTSHQGDALDMQVNYALGRALRRVGVASGDRTGLGNWSPHIHAIPGPKAGHAAGSGPWQFSDYIARGGPRQSMTSPWGLAGGGIAKARRGGYMVRVAEGARDEAIVPLPKDWERGLFAPKGGDTHINIYGDLSLPNIKNGDDAQSFIDNLKSISED